MKKLIAIVLIVLALITIIIQVFYEREAENLFDIDNVREDYTYVSAEIISDYHVIAYYDHPTGGSGEWQWSSGWFHIIHNAPFSQGYYSFSFDAKILEQGDYGTVLRLRLVNDDNVILKELGTIELSQEFKHFIVPFNVDVENADALQIALNSNSVEFKNIQLKQLPYPDAAATKITFGLMPVFIIVVVIASLTGGLIMKTKNQRGGLLP